MADKRRVREPKSNKRTRSVSGNVKSGPSPKGGKKIAAPSRATGAVSAAAGRVSALITQILKKQAATLPGLPKPLPPGTAGAEIPIDRSTFQNLIVALATQDNQAQVWVKDASELLVLAGKVGLTLDNGLVLITVPVSCDQSGTVSIQVPFAVGSKDQPAGLIFATEARPRGPDVVVDVWGEALTAFAWRLLMAALAKVATQSGVDIDGAGLIPIAFAAAPDGVTLLPMSRHLFDRVPQ